MGGNGSGRKNPVALVATEGLALWERQSSETDKAWGAFKIYRDLKPSIRTIHRAAQTSGKTSRYFESWSRKWHWPSRAAAWDREQDRIAKKASDAAIRAMVKRQMKMATDLQDLGRLALVQRIKHIRKSIKVNPDYFAELSVIEITKLAEIGIKLERVLMGESTDIVEHKQDINNDDRRAMMRKILESPDAVEALDTVIEKLEGTG